MDLPKRGENSPRKAISRYFFPPLKHKKPKSGETLPLIRSPKNPKYGEIFPFPIFFSLEFGGRGWTPNNVWKIFFNENFLAYGAKVMGLNWKAMIIFLQKKAKSGDFCSPSRSKNQVVSFHPPKAEKSKIRRFFPTPEPIFRWWIPPPNLGPPPESGVYAEINAARVTCYCAGEIYIGGQRDMASSTLIKRWLLRHL